MKKIYLMAIIAVLNASDLPYFDDAMDKCNRNDGKACYTVGGAYDDLGISPYKNVDRIPIDYYKAKFYYDKACNLGYSDGCESAAFLIEMKKLTFVDYFESNNYHRKACSMGNADGCASLGVNYNEGFGVKQSYEMANKYYYHSCKMGSSIGCYFLGLSFKKGEGVEKDLKVAKELFGRSCELKYENGCKEYAKLNK
jgi:TPR repeat protein